MQYCDSTCDHCAREFWAWWRARAYAGRYRNGRSGGASFDAESVASREKTGAMTTQETDCPDCSGEGGHDSEIRCNGLCGWCGGCVDQEACCSCDGSGVVDVEEEE